MDFRGRFSNKIIRRATFKDQHFDDNCNFLYRVIDKITDREKVTVLTNINANRDLLGELMACQVDRTEEISRKVSQLKDFLEKIMQLDPTKRMSLNEALAHPFVTEKML